MKIIIGCSRNAENKIGSELIRWWQDTDYSHVYIRWYLASQDREIVYHAAHGMVHFLSLDNFTKQNIVVKEFVLDLPDDIFKKLSQKCIDLAGTKYSYMQLVMIFLSDVSGGKIRCSDQKGYICSELMAELLEDFFNAKFDKPIFLLRPDDIIKFLEKHCNTMVQGFI